MVDGAAEVRSSAHRRDSRLELIVQGDERPDPVALETALRACLADPDAA